MAIVGEKLNTALVIVVGGTLVSFEHGWSYRKNSNSPIPPPPSHANVCLERREKVEEERRPPTGRGRPESIMRDMMLSGPPRLMASFEIFRSSAGKVSIIVIKYLRLRLVSMYFRHSDIQIKRPIIFQS